MGEPIKALIFKTMLEVIRRDNLVENVTKVGKHLYDSMDSLSKSAGGSKLIQNLRGKETGTFIAFDCDSSSTRDAFIKHMKMHGINIGVCGDKTVRLRPMLIFEKEHADLFLGRLKEACEVL